MHSEDILVGLGGNSDLTVEEFIYIVQCVHISLFLSPNDVHLTSLFPFLSIVAISNLMSHSPSSCSYRSRGVIFMHLTPQKMMDSLTLKCFVAHVGAAETQSSYHPKCMPCLVVRSVNIDQR